MNEPRRLLNEGGDFERALLDSARFDGPPTGARRRALVALGLGSTIVGAGATVSTATAAASTGAWVLMKWVGIGVLAGLTAVGGAEKIGSISPGSTGVASPPAPHVAVEAPAVAPLRKPEAVAQVEPPVEAKPDQARVESRPVDAIPMLVPKSSDDRPSQASEKPAPEPKAAKDKPAAEAKAAKPEKKTPATLKEEVGYLDEAQKALASGNAGKALELLAQHDGDMKMLRVEANVLKMEALSARGDKAGAAALANAFLAAYPRSPHANRVRSLLAGATSGTSSP